MLDTLTLLQDLESLAIQPYRDGDKLRVRDPGKRMTDDLRTRLRAHKAALMDILPAPEDGAIEDIFGLSPMQSGMLFHSRLAPGQGTYLEHRLFHVDDPAFDIGRFIRAMQQIVNRHDGLRAAFQQEPGADPVQLIPRRVALPVRVLDWRDTPETAYRAQLAALIEQDRRTDFDLSRAPLLRLTVVELGLRQAHRWALLFTNHHILMDRWSSDLFWSELARAYAGEPLAPAPRYRSLIHHLRRLADDEGFWRAYLRGFTEPTPLPGITQPPGEDSGAIASCTLSLSTEQTRRLSDFARARGITLNTLFQSAWGLLLARYSGEPDVLFGMVTSGRTAAVDGIESIIGLCINTLPCRIRLSGNPSGSELLGQVAQTQLQLQQREQTPLVKIRAWSQVAAEGRLFETLFLFQNTARATDPALGDAAPRLIPQWVEPGHTGYPLVALAAPANADGEAVLLISYDSNRYRADSVERLLAHWRQLVLGLASQPELPVAELPMPTDAEQRLILHEWNDTGLDLGPPQTLHALFEQQVARTPDALALLLRGERLTYAELNRRANRLARHLLALGARTDLPIAVCMERSFDLVIALLAVLKAGAAYVPMDPGYPAARIRQMLADCAAPILLTQSHLWPADDLASSVHDLRILCVDALTEDDLSHYPPESPHTKTGPGDLAYVIYTSGSTGQPKGVANQHDGVCNRVRWAQQTFALTPSDRVLQKTPFSFDVSVWEFFWTLSAGATLVIAEPEGHKDPAYLCRLIQETGVTLLHFVPSMLRLFVAERHAAECTSIHALLTSGEALPLDLARATAATLPWAALHNLYGPTEAAVDVSHWVYRPDSMRVPIGRPLANTRLYVLDGAGQLQPVGAIGELHIGGVQLARGYLNRPELTAERFIEHPRLGRLYKTGDRCRWLPDGNLDYLGRTDFQVKVRGQRIELGEIEAALQMQPGVREAVVLAREDSPGDQRLVAYLVGTAQPDAVLRDLARRLPGYMIPSAVVQLDALPLTPNGKLDRRGLPAPSRQRDAAAHGRPRTRLEQRLVEVWERTLNLDPIGIHDNFFELGGHSLLALQLLAELEPVIGRQLPLRTLLAGPTIAALACAAAEERPDPSNVVVLQPKGAQPPLICLPGSGGHVLYLHALARAMGTRRPFLALESVGLDGRAPPHRSVAEAAAHHLRQLTRDDPRVGRPDCPALLAGHSFGGFVAYEMARQLLSDGASVGALIIIDSAAPSGTSLPADEVEAICALEALFLEEYGREPTLTAAALRPLPADQRRMRLKQSLEAAGVFPDGSPIQGINGIIDVTLAARTAADYLPSQPVTVPIHLCLAADRDPRAAAAESLIDGWSRFGQVIPHTVPGTHNTMMYPPQVSGLARIIESIL